MPHLIDDASLVAGIAAAVIALAHREVPEKVAYDDVVQRAYNHIVLRTLSVEGHRIPGSVPEMIDIIADRPVSEWLPGSESQAVLLHGDSRSPTQECAELIVGNRRDPMGEKSENEVIGQVLDACREAGSPESYVAFRRLLITRPTMTYAEQVSECSDVDLVPVAPLLSRCYGPASARLRRNGQYAECGRCHCLLRPVGRDEWRCDLDRCRTSRTTIQRILDAATPGGVFHLQLPLRTFVTGPGLFEIDLEGELLRRGLEVDMWPRYDAYDLLVTFPDWTRWAVDVKDYANPGVLARTFRAIPTDPPRDRAFLVVPDYRRTGDKQYLERFRYARQSAGREPVTLIFTREFLQEVDKKLASLLVGGEQNA
jgi:hypothetical protein